MNHYYYVTFKDFFLKIYFTLFYTVWRMLFYSNPEEHSAVISSLELHQGFKSCKGQCYTLHICEYVTIRYGSRDSCWNSATAHTTFLLCRLFFFNFVQKIEDKAALLLALISPFWFDWSINESNYKTQRRVVKGHRTSAASEEGLHFSVFSN